MDDIIICFKDNYHHITKVEHLCGSVTRKELGEKGPGVLRAIATMNETRTGAEDWRVQGD